MKTLRNTQLTRLVAAMASGWVLLGLNAQAQTTTQPPTDAGQTLNQLQKAPQPLPTGKGLELPADINAKLAGGGKTVSIMRLRFTGNVLIDEARLMQAVGGDAALNRPFDLEALRALVDGVTDHYRASGYPFARAFLLPDSLSGGELTIRLVEGHYGNVVAVSPEERVVRGAARYLSRLKSGEVVTTPALERATLLLDDLPGYSATPVMKPGAQIGAGDLHVVLETREHVQGGLTLDNQGSTYAGQWRSLANIAVNRVAVFGDELTLSAMLPMPDSWMTGATYALPLGAQGARLTMGATRTGYTLSEGFEGFNGTATEKTLGVSYPIVRSRVANLSVSLSYKDKVLRDQKLGEQERKDVATTPLVLSFDRRDSVGQGGVTYGALTAVSGILKAAGTQTNFSRWQLDVARLQRASQSWSLYAHTVVHGTHDNLDSSEGLSLGGATGVRAYPSGEAAGDKGWLIQLEARKTLGQAQAYAFYDHGTVQVDARPEVAKSPARDQVRAGVGVGVRFQRDRLNMNMALAWRTQGGAPKAESSDPKPRIWFSLSHSF